MEKRVLVVEDEQSIQRILQYELVQAGFQVEVASDGDEGFRLAKDGGFDVILLDVMLPKRDGFSICRDLREHKVSSFIIMLSARDDEFNRVLGLDVGADDYMTKPFSSREVVSKVKAMVRRKEMTIPLAKEDNHLKYQGLTLNPDKFEVRYEEALIDFTLKEYELLAFLIKNKDKTLSRDVLLDHLWGMEYFGETRVVDVHIFKIRDKLKPYNIKIKTVRGVGYMLEGDRSA